jgi:hypothetical protein
MANWKDLTSQYLDALHAASKVVARTPSHAAGWSGKLSDLHVDLTRLHETLETHPYLAEVSPEDEPLIQNLEVSVQAVRRELTPGIGLDPVLNELWRQSHKLLTGAGGDGRGRPKAGEGH